MPDCPLDSFSLLQGVAPDELAALRLVLTEKVFARREVVLTRGETGPGLGFLLEGRLQGVDFTVDGREVGLYFVEPGDYFGELPVVDGRPGAEFIIAVAKAKVLFLPRERARTLIFSSPEIAEKVMCRLADRVRSVTAQRILLSLPNPFQRLCVQLLQLVPEGGATIASAPTHQELAIMINTSRETVTRAFQLLQNREILRRESNQIQLLDRQFLLDIAEGRLDPPKN